MRKGLRAAATTCILLLAAFSVSVFLAPNVSAASRTWTTDTDFNDPGATFTATEVVGTGVNAKVELLKDHWMNMSPPSAPRAREGSGLAFDSFGNRSILFGGYGNTFYLGDTWEYDFPANTWTEILTNPHPIGRESPKMSYDPVERVVVLHGGINDTDPALYMSDTWEFDVVSNKWALANPMGPRTDGLDSAMVYDSAASKHILVGYNSSEGQFQTWAYDAATNTWTLRTTGGPSPRSGHAIAYDELRQKVVLFGGGSIPGGSFYDDTWEYDDATTTWTSLYVRPPLPPNRYLASMTYHTGSNSVVLFGGMNSSAALNDTWRYRGGQSWIYTGTALIPPPRGLAPFTYDSSVDAAILFGGRKRNYETLGDTWTYGAAYRAAGKYANAALDPICGDVHWKTIWWNKTTQPADTFLRFQIATSDIVDPHFWLYVGPNGSYSSYYNASGTVIWPGLDNHRYLRFLGDFGSYDPRATPSIEDVTIDYACPPAPPYIVFTDPVHQTFDFSMSEPIHVMFSKPMDTSSVTWQFLKGTPINFTPVWTEEDTYLNLTHTESLGENEVYELQVAGRSKDGADLIPNPIDPYIVNPWWFVIERVNPFIVKANPAQGAVDVSLSADVVIDFSEPMVPSTVEWMIYPSIANNGTWTSGNTRLILSHYPEFQDCTLYFVDVTKGEDRVGAPLSPGPKPGAWPPNPWSFRTICKGPFVYGTYPGDLAMGIQLSWPILVNFSEPMDPSSVTWQLLRGIPVTFTPSWTDGNRRLKLTHQDFLGCTVYEIKIDGKDVDGNDLVPAPNPPGRPNPWMFMTVCANPFIFFSDPPNGAKNVSLDRLIQIGFSITMNTTSVTWTITPSIRQLPPEWAPQYGDPVNVSLRIPHLRFEQCLRYTVNITSGRSKTGLPLVRGPAPNPFFFDTICERPYLLSTDPADRATLVPLDKSIVVEFSEPMNASSYLFILNPDITGKSYEWSNNNQTLTFGHTGAFAQGTLYTAFVDGVGADGNGLLMNGPQAPDPWTFTTRFPGFYIASTDPSDMAASVPVDKKIVVTFSEAADLSSFSSSIVPGPTLTPEWSDGNRKVTLNHTTLFQECTWHTVTVTARDSGGSPLITVPGSAPNPWTFKSACTPPYIVTTDPPDGEIYVPINKTVVVTFSEQMNRTSVKWTVSPAFQLNGSWTNGDRVLSLSSPTPFKTVKTYCIAVDGKDLDGMSLVPGPAPNPWCFTTNGTIPPPGGLELLRFPPNDILLMWRLVPMPSITYVVYSSTSRFAPWPWPQLVETPMTGFLAAGSLTDGLNHFYIVRAKGGEELSTNSTMAAKTQLNFTSNGLKGNIHWFSLPYRTEYKKASDISDELTSTRINVVAKWNPATQTPILWFFLRGEWRGTDFAIRPGDGLYIGAVKAFSWVIMGTDLTVTLPFNLNPPTLGNVYWISLPYTSAYSKASSIVFDLEGSIGPGAHTKITELGRWDLATQTVIKYMWTASGWSGTDFMINPGDGIYLKIVASFAWTPRLITPEVP